MFFFLKNVSLLINYFSTNNSIIITKRTIHNFLSQLSLVSPISLQQTPKNKNFHRNFLEKLLRNQDNISKIFLPEAQKDTALQRQKLHTLWIIVIKRHVPMFSCYIDCCHLKKHMNTMIPLSVCVGGHAAPCTGHHDARPHTPRAAH